MILIRTAAHNPSIHQQNDVFKIGMMALDLALIAEDTSVYGVAAIFDMKGVTLGHAKALTVQMIKKAVTSWQVFFFSLVIMHKIIILTLIILDRSLLW